MNDSDRRIGFDEPVEERTGAIFRGVGGQNDVWSFGFALEDPIDPSDQTTPLTRGEATIKARHSLDFFVRDVAHRERNHLLMRGIDGDDFRAGVLVGKAGVEANRALPIDEHPHEDQDENQEDENAGDDKEKQVSIDALEKFHDLVPPTLLNA